jgi:DNA polymerase elongation subunit (family B)
MEGGLIAPQEAIIMRRLFQASTPLPGSGNVDFQINDVRFYDVSPSACSLSSPPASVSCPLSTDKDKIFSDPDFPDETPQSWSVPYPALDAFRHRWQERLSLPPPLREDIHNTYTQAHLFGRTHDGHSVCCIVPWLTPFWISVPDAWNTSMLQSLVGRMREKLRLPRHQPLTWRIDRRMSASGYEPDPRAPLRSCKRRILTIDCPSLSCVQQLKGMFPGNRPHMAGCNEEGRQKAAAKFADWFGDLNLPAWSTMEQVNFDARPEHKFFFDMHPDMSMSHWVRVSLDDRRNVLNVPPTWRRTGRDLEIVARFASLTPLFGNDNKVAPLHSASIDIEATPPVKAFPDASSPTSVISVIGVNFHRYGDNGTGIPSHRIQLVLTEEAGEDRTWNEEHGVEIRWFYAPNHDASLVRRAEMNMLNTLRTILFDEGDVDRIWGYNTILFDVDYMRKRMGARGPNAVDVFWRMSHFKNMITEVDVYKMSNAAMGDNEGYTFPTPGALFIDLYLYVKTMKYDSYKLGFVAPQILKDPTAGKYSIYVAGETVRRCRRLLAACYDMVKFMAHPLLPLGADIGYVWEALAYTARVAVVRERQEYLASSPAAPAAAPSLSDPPLVLVDETWFRSHDAHTLDEDKKDEDEEEEGEGEDREETHGAMDPVELHIPLGVDVDTLFQTLHRDVEASLTTPEQVDAELVRLQFAAGNPTRVLDKALAQLAHQCNHIINHDPSLRARLFGADRVKLAQLIRLSRNEATVDALHPDDAPTLYMYYNKLFNESKLADYACTHEQLRQFDTERIMNASSVNMIELFRCYLGHAYTDARAMLGDDNYARLFAFRCRRRFQTINAIYCSVDCDLPLRIVQTISVSLFINAMSIAAFTLPRLIIGKGLQIKVYSVLLRNALRLGYVLPYLQLAWTEQPDYEGAIVLTPTPGYYADPVPTLDFNSLYPSALRARNTCFSSLVNRVSSADMAAQLNDAVRRELASDPQQTEQLLTHAHRLIQEEPPATLKASLDQLVEQHPRASPTRVHDIRDARTLSELQWNLAQDDPLQRLREMGKTKSIVKLHNLTNTVHPELADPVEVHSIQDGRFEFAFVQHMWSLCFRAITALLDARKRVQNSMKDFSESSTDYMVLHNLQLALKLIANASYGFMGITTPGVGIYPCLPVALVITLTGRKAITETKRYIEENFGSAQAIVEHANAYRGPYACTMEMTDSMRGSEVLYGDTDSVMVKLPGFTLEQAFCIAHSMEETLNSIYPKFMVIAFEKVMMPFCVFMRKKYIARVYKPNKKMTIDGGKTDGKGVSTVRRDVLPVSRRLLQEVINTVMDVKSGLGVRERFVRAYTMAATVFDAMVRNALPLEDWTLRKTRKSVYKGALRKGVVIEGETMHPHTVVVERKRQRGDMDIPSVGEGVYYTFVCHAGVRFNTLASCVNKKRDRTVFAGRGTDRVDGKDKVAHCAEDPEYVRQMQLRVDTCFLVSNQMLHLWESVDLATRNIGAPRFACLVHWASRELAAQQEGSGSLSHLRAETPVWYPLHANVSLDATQRRQRGIVGSAHVPRTCPPSPEQASHFVESSNRAMVGGSRRQGVLDTFFIPRHVVSEASASARGDGHCVGGSGVGGGFGVGGSGSGSGSGVVDGVDQCANDLSERRTRRTCEKDHVHSSP